MPQSENDAGWKALHDQDVAAVGYFCFMLKAYREADWSTFEAARIMLRTLGVRVDLDGVPKEAGLNVTELEISQAEQVVQRALEQKGAADAAAN